MMEVYAKLTVTKQHRLSYDPQGNGVGEKLRKKVIKCFELLCHSNIRLVRTTAFSSYGFQKCIL